MPKLIDLTGMTFGKLFVVGRAGIDQASGQCLWECVCSCPAGKTRIVLSNNLRRGTSTSCGCARIEATRKAALKKREEAREMKLSDMPTLTLEPTTPPEAPPPVPSAARRKRFVYMVGKRSGKLIVEGDSGQRGDDNGNIGNSVIWDCKCDCGRTRKVATHSLKTQAITHCGECDPIDPRVATGYITADGPVRRVSDIPFMPSPIPVPTIPAGAIAVDPFPVGFFGRLRMRAALWLLG